MRKVQLKIDFSRLWRPAAQLGSISGDNEDDGEAISVEIGGQFCNMTTHHTYGNQSMLCVEEENKA